MITKVADNLRYDYITWCSLEFWYSVSFQGSFEYIIANLKQLLLSINVRLMIPYLLKFLQTNKTICFKDMRFSVLLEKYFFSFFCVIHLT